MIVIVTAFVFDAVAHLAVPGTSHRTARERTMRAVKVCLCVVVCGAHVLVLVFLKAGLLLNGQYNCTVA